MFVDFFLRVFEQNADRDAIVWRGKTLPYSELGELFAHWDRWLSAGRVASGQVVVVEADFSPNAVALMLALIQRGAIIVPLTKSVAAKRDEFITTAQAEICIGFDSHDYADLRKTGNAATNPILRNLATSGHPGLILFSSGSTGKSKAAVHDLVGILNKFKVKRHPRRAITFLLYDHIGGINTMFYQLSNGGCIVTVAERDPDTVLRAIQEHQVDTLPTSPTFINLIILSEAYRRYDLSSLKLVTYGTEPMPASTLRRFHELLPEVQLQQTYGLSEIGILRSKSQASDSLWVKLGGEGFQTRVSRGMLEVKAESAMLGYLNAPSPFTPDGWFITGDRVEVDGEYFKILGRDSEIINVGGQKVYPAEVESVIQEMPDVAEVAVYGEKNPIIGQIVCAHVRLRRQIDPKEASRTIRQFCHGRLQSFQVPLKIDFAETGLHGARFKKLRQASSKRANEG